MAPALVWHYDFDAITACAVGGISLSGGRGTILNTLSGVLFLGFINNSMILIGVPYRWQLILKGLILLLAIIADMQTKKSYA
jgi:ribose/xylose/arabinose/galactoside ABC-type transport system permease subunit